MGQRYLPFLELTSNKPTPAVFTLFGIYKHMLNKALRLIRTYHDMSQTELCVELGMSNSYLSEIEAGRKQPSLDLLKKYSDYFEIPLSSILFFSENIERKELTGNIRKSIASKVISILEWSEKKADAKERLQKAAKGA